MNPSARHHRVDGGGGEVVVERVGAGERQRPGVGAVVGRHCDQVDRVPALSVSAPEPLSGWLNADPSVLNVLNSIVPPPALTTMPLFALLRFPSLTAVGGSAASRRRR